ncbi:MAG TPA: nuclear transport factor 2 family protein [Candidatus Limnocylindria bacterium]|nr:nuclear transport factor 2 family protein [Candidatus Limnocylindria bacterium]
MDALNTRSGREILERIVDATERHDIEALRPLMHDEIVGEWPQSGERFSGPENAIGAMTATETKPDVAGEPRILGSDDLWVMMLPLRYGTEPYHYVGVFELDGGRLRHVTEYFSAPFPASEARAAYADPSPQS